MRAALFHHRIAELHSAIPEGEREKKALKQHTVSVKVARPMSLHRLRSLTRRSLFDPMNQRSPASWLRTVATFLLFVLITLGLLEGALRLTVDRGTLYRGLSLYPELNRKKFESEFSKQYADKPFNMETYDPHLGWDFDIRGDRIRGKENYPLKKPASGYRIVAIGDSFAYGTDVDTAESFPSHLEQILCNTEALNMGVPGYGIDQAVFKYLAHGKAYAPDAVILGIFLDDYERASVSFHAFSKPWIRPDEAGNYRLANRPVPLPQTELERIRSEEAHELYSLALLRNLWMRFNTLIQGEKSALDRIDGAVVHILKALQSELRDTGTQLLIVQIPGANMFTRPETPWERTVSKHLIKIYRALGIPYVDLYSAFRAQHAPEEIFGKFYVRLANGTTGHLSAAGNAETAKQIIEALRSIDARLPPHICPAQAKPPT
jgi:GDSL-like Lipase/Acylhydrolase family